MNIYVEQKRQLFIVKAFTHKMYVQNIQINVKYIMTFFTL